MTTVADQLAQSSRRRVIIIGGLILVWLVLVMLDIDSRIAKDEWVGLPVLLAFLAVFAYLLYFASPRCPACHTAIHSAWPGAFRPYPKWVPLWFARLAPRKTHCVQCGLPFRTPLAEVTPRAL
jgi:hypothetical protein